MSAFKGKEQEIELKELAWKHEESRLSNKIKNLEDEKAHILKESDYCREVTAELSLKLARMCEEYEINQVAIMKRNRSLAVELGTHREGLEMIEVILSKEKTKPSSLISYLKDLKLKLLTN